jgi:hypothetical protein
VTEREERFSRNEVLFREVNERVEKVQKGQGLSGHFDFLCECGDKTCIEQVSITLVEYEGIRSEPTHFVVLPVTSFWKSRASCTRAIASQWCASKRKPR